MEYKEKKKNKDRLLDFHLSNWVDGSVTVIEMATKLGRVGFGEGE